MPDSEGQVNEMQREWRNDVRTRLERIEVLLESKITAVESTHKDFDKRLRDQETMTSRMVGGMFVLQIASNVIMWFLKK